MTPSVIQVGPFTYRVTRERTDWAGIESKRGSAYGYTDHAAQTIYVQPGLAAAMERVVVLHEVMHAAVFASGEMFTSEHDKETWVLRTAPMLLDALRRSDGLTAYLAQSASGGEEATDN